MREGFVLLCIVSVLAACSDERPETSSAARTDSAGIEIVSNGASEVSLGWTFEPELTLGGTETGEESFYQLTARSLTFDVEGRIYVLDGGNRRVQIFTDAGEYVRTVGQEGDGPGEFQGPSSIAVDGDGTIRVHDFVRRAVLLFDSAGVFVDQRPAPRRIFGPLRFENGAKIFATRSRRAESTELEFGVHRVTELDTADLVTVPLPSTKSVMYESCGVRISLPAMFDNPPAWDARGVRVVIAEAPLYSVRVFEGAQEVRRLRRALEPERATAELAAEELGDGEDWVIGDTPCTVPAAEVVESRGIAERVPLVAAVVSAPDGATWVRREVIGEPGPVDVFDPTGQYLGTLPADTPWPAAFSSDGRILALQTDELGVQRVVVYRVLRE